jgi:hypothetical protein
MVTTVVDDMRAGVCTACYLAARRTMVYMPPPARVCWRLLVERVSALIE